MLFFLNGVLFATWASRIPAVQAERGLGHGALGLALLSIALGAVIAMPLAGWLTARIGSDKVSKATALIYCAMLPGIVLAPDLVTFVLALFCFGASHGALDVAMNAQAVAIEKRYGKPIMSSFHALWSTGGLVGAATGGLLAAKGMKPLAHFDVVALLFGAAAVLVCPHLLNPPERQTSDTRELKRDSKFPLPSRELFALGTVALCIMAGEGAMADWSAVYLRNSVGTGESLAAAGYATFSIAMASGRFLGDYLTARFGSVNLVRVGGTVAASGLLLALVSGHAAISLIGFALVGAGFATLVPIVFSAAGNTAGKATGIALASVSTLGYLGFLIGPPFIGFAAELFGLRFALGIIVVTSLIAVVLAPTLGGRVNIPRILKPNN
jgi:MFS family permease